MLPGDVGVGSILLFIVAGLGLLFVVYLIVDAIISNRRGRPPKPFKEK